VAIQLQLDELEKREITVADGIINRIDNGEH
jgi:hypothetical protein